MPDSDEPDPAPPGLRDHILGYEDNAAAGDLEALGERLTASATDDQFERLGASIRAASALPPSSIEALRNATSVHSKVAATLSEQFTGMRTSALDDMQRNWLDRHKVDSSLTALADYPEPYRIEVPELPDLSGMVTIGDVVEAIEGQQGILVSLVEEARLSRELESERWVQAQADRAADAKANDGRWRIELILLVMAILVGVASIVAAG